MNGANPSRIPDTGEPVPLRAGPLTALSENGGLRYIKLGDKEVIRRIYAAVRDHNWTTIPGGLRNVRIDNGRDFFHVTFDSEHLQGDISFVWRGEIIGEPDGTIRFTFDGEARSTFLKSRIGFCVLHPIKECAGRNCEVECTDGTTREAAFPRLVAPEQPVKDIHDLRAISHEVEPGCRAEVRFEGDIFEMEDQRNWIDASYKTFCTPLRLPYPVAIKAGTRIQQSVTLRLLGNRSTRIELSRDEPIRLNVDFAKAHPLRPIGLGVSSFQEKYSSETIERLRALNLAHLRADLNLSGDWRAALAHAEWEARAIGVPLEIALTLPRNGTPDLAPLVEWTSANHDHVKRFIVYTENAKTTEHQSFWWVSSKLGSFAPIGIGANADFYQLNQFRPNPEDVGFIAWSMNPQVHAFDELSIMEAPEAVPAQLESARAYFPGKPLMVSPITLKPRFNPVATAPEKSRRDQLPPEVDLRQGTRLAAAWTFAMLKQLLEAGVDSATLFETVGWRGLIERDSASPDRPGFLGDPKELFPVYFAFQLFAPFSHGQMIFCHSTSPREIECLALKKDGKTRIIAVNLTATPKRVESPLVHGLLEGYGHAAWTAESGMVERTAERGNA